MARLSGAGGGSVCAVRAEQRADSFASVASALADAPLGASKELALRSVHDNPDSALELLGDEGMSSLGSGAGPSQDLDEGTLALCQSAPGAGLAAPLACARAGARGSTSPCSPLDFCFLQGESFAARRLGAGAASRARLFPTRRSEEDSPPAAEVVAPEQIDDLWEVAAASGGSGTASRQAIPPEWSLFGRLRLDGASSAGPVQRAITDGLTGVHKASSLLAMAAGGPSEGISAAAARSLLGEAAAATARRSALENAAAEAASARGLVPRALAAAISAELRALDAALIGLPNACAARRGDDASVPPRPPTMLEAMLHTEGARAHLRTLHVMLCHNDGVEAAVAASLDSSAALIDALCARASSADASSEPIARRLLAAAMRPYVAMLRQWLASGACEDPFCEFFVDQVAPHAQLLLDGPRRPPACLQGVASLALAAGLQVRVLAAYPPTLPLAERLGDLAAQAGDGVPLGCSDGTLLTYEEALTVSAKARSSLAERFFAGRRAARTAAAAAAAAAASEHRAATLRAIRLGVERARLRSQAAVAARRGDVATVAALAAAAVRTARAAEEARAEADAGGARAASAFPFEDGADVRAQAVADASAQLLASHAAWMRALEAAEARAEWRRVRYEAAVASLPSTAGNGASDEAEAAAETAILSLEDDDFVTLTRGTAGPDTSELHVAADFGEGELEGGFGGAAAAAASAATADDLSAIEGAEGAEVAALAGEQGEALNASAAEVVRLTGAGVDDGVGDLDDFGAALAPLDVALGASVVKEVRLWHSSTSECVLRLLMDEQRLVAHLEAIRLVALMRAGDAARDLVEGLEARCCGTASIGRPTPGEAELASLLEGALRGSSVDPAAVAGGASGAAALSPPALAAARCSLGWAGGRPPAVVDGNSLGAFDALTFRYDASGEGGGFGGALCTVLCDDAAAGYSELMRFQLRVARAQGAADAAFVELSAAERFVAARERLAARHFGDRPEARVAAVRAARGLRERLRVAQLYRLEAAHVVKALREHTGAQLLGTCWTRLMDDLSEACTLTDVTRAHGEYLAEAQVRCLLAEDQAAARRAVEDVLQGALGLRRFVAAVTAHEDSIAAEAGAGAAAAATLADEATFTALRTQHGYFRAAATQFYDLLGAVASRQAAGGGAAASSGGAAALLECIDHNGWASRVVAARDDADAVGKAGRVASPQHFYTPAPGLRGGPLRG